MKMNKNRKNSSRIRQVVKGILNEQLEEKIVISSISAAATTVAGTVLNLSNFVAQGDQFNQRSGDKIYSLQQSIKFNATALINSQATRFIVFQDHQQNGTLPVVQDVLDTVDYLAQYSSLNVYQQRRFTILMDRTLDVNIAGEAVKTRQVKLPAGKKIFYNGATAVNTSNGKNAIFILVIASATSGTYDYSWEMKYHDA